MNAGPVCWLLFLVAAAPQEIARSTSYTEGPVFDRAGNLYFSPIREAS